MLVFTDQTKPQATIIHFNMKTISKSDPRWREIHPGNFNKNPMQTTATRLARALALSQHIRVAQGAGPFVPSADLDAQSGKPVAYHYNKHVDGVKHCMRVPLVNGAFNVANEVVCLSANMPEAIAGGISPSSDGSCYCKHQLAILLWSKNFKFSMPDFMANWFNAVYRKHAATLAKDEATLEECSASVEKNAAKRAARVSAYHEWTKWTGANQARTPLHILQQRRVAELA